MAINLDHVTEQITVTDTATNASLTVQPKGTGAFNIAAGSSGLNLSNGGTVTAITRTATGSGYTSIPAVVISAPTTTGGVQATATITTMLAANPTTVQSGGTGYTLNDILTFSGGTPTGGAGTYRVTAVSAGVVTAVTAENYANYSALATNPVSTTGGTGTGCTLNVTYAVQANSFTITNAGSGYVEQPTVTFSGGGGSGAAAFATIGSNTAIRTQGSYASFYSSNSGSESLRLYGNDTVNGQFQQTSGPGMFIMPAQSGFGALRLGSVLGFHELWFVSGSSISLTTGANGNVGQGTRQLQVSNTASAVNYLNITGGATGSGPAISALGSDTDINLSLSTKNNGSIFLNAGGTNRVQVDPFGGVNLAVSFSGGVAFKALAVGNQVNFLQAAGATTGFQPILSVQGSDANVGPVITSKGSGSIDFYTQNVGARQFSIANTASAVNYVQVTGAATGGVPTVIAQGSDSSVGMGFATKSANYLYFLQSGANPSFRITTGATSNYLDVKGGATGVAPVISAQGSDTNIPAVVQPKGTGALQAQQTDSTATGGNARGANAVDWQTSRASASQVASAQWSTISGGVSNTASSTAAVVGGGATNTASNTYTGVLSGQNGTASGPYSVVSGGYTNTASGFVATVVGGSTNTASSTYSFVGSGQLNTAGGIYNVIGGGFTNSATSGTAVTTQSGTMNGTNAVTLSGSNASIKVGQLITGTSIAGDTYVAAISGTSLTLSKVASGSSTSTLSFYTPHGVVVGGGNNQATGSYSFIGGGGDAGTAAGRNISSGDWAFVGGGRANTASAIGSIVVGGGFSDTTVYAGNTASGIGSLVVGGIGNSSTGVTSSVVGGEYHLANGNRSFVAGGAWGTTRGIVGNHVFSASNNPMQLAVLGTQQTALLVLARQTTDATPTVLCSTGSGPSGVNQVILPNNSAYYFRGEVVAGVTGGGNTKGWFIEGVIKRGANAASTALVGTPTVTSLYADAGAATWTIAVTADTTNGGLAVTFTGQTGTTIRTVAQIRTTEMTF